MNRLRSVASSVAENFSMNFGYQSDSALSDMSLGGTKFFVPTHYEPNYAYPLVIWLHADGGNQSEIDSIMPLLSVQNYIGIGICGPQAIDSAAHGFAWAESDSGIAIAEECVFSSIEAAAQRYTINPKHVFVMGHRAGGTMALRLGLRHPKALRAAISLGGQFPQGRRPLSNLAIARRLQMLLVRCADESHYPTEQLCEDLRTLHTARLQLNVRQYDSLSELDPEILCDVNRWLMGQITGSDPFSTTNLTDTVPVEFSCN